MEFTKKQRLQFGEFGRAGAIKQAEGMTQEERTARARKAVQARWAKVKAAKEAKSK